MKQVRHDVVVSKSRAQDIEFVSCLCECGNEIIKYGEFPYQTSGGQSGLYHFCKNRVIEECNRKAEHLLLGIESIQLY